MCDPSVIFCFLMNGRAEIEARFLKAAAAFEECGFISVRSFKTNNREVTKTKPLYQQKSRDPHQVSCIVRVQQSRSDDDKLKALASKVAAALLHAHNEVWCGERLFC